MPPLLALLLCAVFTFWLFRVDARARGPMSAALWIAFIWVAIRGSRPLTFWFASGPMGSELEGNPVDRVFFLVLFAAAFLVLQRRQLEWGRLVNLNPFLFILLAYLALSTLWAPYPFVAFKRWFKEIGALFILLVIMTEPDPFRAFRTIAVRCAYLLFPLSIVLNRYFPELGRAYSNSGGMMVTGVTGHKNTLGQICCVFGLALLSEVLEEKSISRNGGAIFRLARWGVLALGAWLLLISNSATSLVAALIGLALLLLTRLESVRARIARFSALTWIGVTTALLVAAFGTSLVNPVLAALGRDATFTGRVKIWSVALNQDVNPWFGSGFYSFWLAEGDSMREAFVGVDVGVAHNGYLEMFLDGGAIACFLFLLVLLQTAVRLTRSMANGAPFARIGFMYAITFVIMNYSESYAFRLGPLWFAFLFSSILASGFAWRRHLALSPVQAPVEPFSSGSFAR
jgi:O-antigen ligase